MTDPAPRPTDLKDTLEDMRAAMAVQGARKGLAGTIEGAILKLLEVLLTILVDFRAGRLAALAAEEARAGRGCEETPSESVPTPFESAPTPSESAPTPALPRRAGEGACGGVRGMIGARGAQGRKAAGGPRTIAAERGFVTRGRGGAARLLRPDISIARRGHRLRGLRAAPGPRRNAPRKPPCRAGPGRRRGRKRGIEGRECARISLRYSNINSACAGMTGTHRGRACRGPGAALEAPIHPTGKREGP